MACADGKVERKSAEIALFEKRLQALGGMKDLSSSSYNADQVRLPNDSPFLFLLHNEEGMRGKREAISLDEHWMFVGGSFRLPLKTEELWSRNRGSTSARLACSQKCAAGDCRFSLFFCDFQ